MGLKKEQTNKMKAIGYVRGSMETQKLTLGAQKEKIKAYAFSKDLNLIDILIEEGRSGKDLDRPKMRQLLAMVAKKEIDAVVIYKLDRMFRNTQNALEIADIFQKNGIAFHSIHESIDTESPYGKFFYTIINAFAELERNVICGRIKDILQYKKANGKVYAPVPYGYERKGGEEIFDKNGNKKIHGGELVENKEEQKIKHTIIKLKRDGLGLRAIVTELEIFGIKTRKGGTWHPQQIKNILKT